MLVGDLFESHQADAAALIANGMKDFDGLSDSWFRLHDAFEATESQFAETMSTEQLGLLQGLLRAVRVIMENI